MPASGNDTESTILPAQVRAARGLLDWSRDQLVNASGVPKSTLVRLEEGAVSPQRRTLSAIRNAFEQAGVEFTDGEAPGVRLRGSNRNG